MTHPSDPGAERFHERRRRKEEQEKQLPGDDQDPLPPPTEPIRVAAIPKRNEPCPCGSGKKYKNCCATHAS